MNHWIVEPFFQTKFSTCRSTVAAISPKTAALAAIEGPHHGPNPCVEKNWFLKLKYQLHSISKLCECFFYQAHAGTGCLIHSIHSGSPVTLPGDFQEIQRHATAEAHLVATAPEIIAKAVAGGKRKTQAQGGAGSEWVSFFMTTACREVIMNHVVERFFPKGH